MSTMTTIPEKAQPIPYPEFKPASAKAKAQAVEEWVEHFLAFGMIADQYLKWDEMTQIDNEDVKHDFHGFCVNRDPDAYVDYGEELKGFNYLTGSFYSRAAAGEEPKRTFPPRERMIRSYCLAKGLATFTYKETGMPWDIFRV